MKQISSQNIYNGFLKLYRDEVELENGQRTYREVVVHKEASAVVAVNSRNELLMVRQHRYPIHEDLLEIPAGLIDEGESPLDAAIRELREETGYEAARWHLLSSIIPSPGCNNEVIHLFAAEGLTYVSGEHLDDDEVLVLETIPIDSVLEKIKSGEIRDGKSVAGILIYKLQSEN